MVDLQLIEQVAYHHHGVVQGLPFGVDYLGAGSCRTAYVDYGSGLVYKIGLHSVNRREVATLARLRAQGADYAPTAELVEVDVPLGRGGELVPVSVVVMPYLPEDGSVEHAHVRLPGAVDRNRDNVVANGGRLWLIDAGG